MDASPALAVFAVGAAGAGFAGAGFEGAAVFVVLLGALAVFVSPSGSDPQAARVRAAVAVRAIVNFIMVLPFRPYNFLYLSQRLTAFGWKV